MGMGPGFISTAVFENSAYVSRSDLGATPPWPGVIDGRINVSGIDVPMSWYLTRDEKRAIEQAIPPDPTSNHYTQILSNFERHKDDFRGDDGKYRLLGRALNYASLGSTSKRAGVDRAMPAFIDPDSYDRKDVESLHEHFRDLGMVFNYYKALLVEPEEGVTTESAPAKPGPDEVRRLGRLLVDASGQANKQRAARLRIYCSTPIGPRLERISDRHSRTSAASWRSRWTSLPRNGTKRPSCCTRAQIG